MTIFIRHRVNRISDVTLLDQQHGAEIDLRSDLNHKGRIHLSHDPWVAGDDFEEWLGAFRSAGILGPLILNTKEDGLESRAQELLARAGVTNYFFLDTTIPTLVTLTLRKKLPCFAVRFSHYEPAECVRKFKDRAQWLWVDCFEGKPVPLETLKSLSSSFKTCLVSPELQGQPIQSISKFRRHLRWADAVCTKSPESWLA